MYHIVGANFITLTAKWERAQQITLYEEDINETNYKIQTTLYIIDGKVYSDGNLNNEINKINVPTKSGYQFRGYKFQGTNIWAIDEQGNIDKTEIKGAGGDYNLVAEWEKVSTITLNKNGGTGGTNELYTLGGKVYSNSICTNEINKISVPTKTGYEFKGYYYTTEGTTSSEYKIIDESGNLENTDIAKDVFAKEENITLTAKWESIQTITVDKDGGTGGPNYLYVSDGVAYSDMNCTTEVSNITVPTKSGYKFKGYRSSFGSIIVYEDGTIYEQAIRATWTGTKADYTITAQWEEITVSRLETVTLSPNAGQGRPYVYIGTDYNLYLDSDCKDQMTSTENPIIPPTENGKIFKGYGFGESGAIIINENGYARDGIAQMFEQSGIRALTARWESKRLGTVTLSPNAGQGRPYVYIGKDYNLYLDSDCTMQMTSTENPIIPPTENGKIFKGYGFGESGAIIINENGYARDGIAQMFEQSRIRALTAQWEDGYTVTIQPGGETFTGKEGDTVTIDNVSKPTLTFNHNNDGETSSITAGCNVSCTTGTIDIKDESEINYTFGNSDATITITFNEITLVTPAMKEGCNFEGWYTEDGTRIGGAGDTYRITEDQTLYAHWVSVGVPPAVQYVATIQPGGEKITGEEGDTTNIASYISRPTLTFDYNYNNATSNITPGARITCTAGRIETISENEVNYTFGNDNATITITLNDITLETPETREDYKFEGWYTEDGTRVGGAGDTYNITEDKTIYAHWSSIGDPPPAVTEYTATIQPGGKTLKGKEGDTVTIKKVSKPTLTFNHNYDGKTSSITTSFNVSCTTGTINTEDESEINYTFGNSDATITITLNDITLETPRTREGYEFEGWYTEKEGGTRIGGAGDTYNIEEDQTLYAHWKKIDNSGNGNNQGGNSLNGNNGNSNNNSGSNGLENNKSKNQTLGFNTAAKDSTMANGILPKTGSIVWIISIIGIIIIGAVSAIQYKKYNIK